ncbi:MAG: nicotinate (nicotinamide) nucleotide adenylyltransferase [Victivallales bacterium]|nr:nicotinate (nicotinamide) nucleotide adenylyltransferase [Victivallales bacterium]
MSGDNKRILVFGGTFDPPNNGHISLVSGVLRAELADGVVFVPALRPPHKPFGVSAKFADRAIMLRMAVDAAAELSGRTIVSELEAERSDSPSYTYDTMLELSSRMPDDELILLIGADSLINLHTWREARKLVEKWSLLTFPRDAAVSGSEKVFYTLRSNWPEEVVAELMDSILNFSVIDISSSDIRKRLANGDLDSAERFLPSNVFEYIKTKGVYGKV